MGDNHIRRMYPLWGMIPGLLIFLIFFMAPFLMTFYYSFTNWDFYTYKFIGLYNYIEIIKDDTMSIALKNTLIFTFFTSFFKVTLGMIIAIFVNRQLKTSNYFRAVFYLPAILNTVAIGILFTAILHPENGILNRALGSLHLDFLQFYWLTNVKMAIYSIGGIEIWKWTGYNMIILLAGLQSVSKDYYEAAEIDGASGIRKFWHITFPLILPAFNVTMVGNIIGGLKVFDLVSSTTGGGPGRATEVLNTAIFESFGNGLQGMASAGNVVLSLFVAIISVMTYLVIRRKEVEQ